MSQLEENFRLYRVVKAVTVGGCIEASLQPVGINPAYSLKHQFCDEYSATLIKEGKFIAVNQYNADEWRAAMVGLSVRLDKVENNEVMLFAFPRPAQLYISTKDTELLDLVKEAQASGQGIVFALKADGWRISDAALLSPDGAEKQLGITRMRP